MAVLVAAACILFSVSYRIIDTDLWQHLAVGRAIWALHGVPHGQIWCWPGYGEPYVTPSWGFRALLWPFWLAGGVPGLFAWRWLTTMAAFALLWAAARRMGARGFTPLVVLVVASLVYRARSQVRPETLAAILFALELWILETRRSGGPDRTRWFAAIGWVWVNVHISFPLGLAVLALHDAGIALEAWIRERRAPSGSAAPASRPSNVVSFLRRDLGTAVAMVGLWFANPFGWSAVVEPFQYFLVWRREPIFRAVIELKPVQWNAQLTNGLPILVAGWLLLMLWRARRRDFDFAEALLAAFLLALALPAQRFAGVFALGAAPYLARDFDAWVRTRRWPRWIATSTSRATLSSAACVIAGVAEWSNPELRAGVGVRMEFFPVRACDFIAAHGVRGRGYNDYYLGGCMLWRFWPDRTRLPFMDIHQTGTRDDRRLVAGLSRDASAWRELDGRYRFDFALLNCYWNDNDRSRDALDADTSFALVFKDDAAALYVRRAGALAPVADSFAYRVIPAGEARMLALGESLATDAPLRARATAEFERSIRASEFNSVAHSNLASLAMIEGRLDVARAELEQALARDPSTRHAWERLAVIALSEGRFRAALEALAHEGPSAERAEIREQIRSEARAGLRALEKDPPR